MPLIMGTAGHIDHGKTSLVKALTGIDCDRLSEEKERGITIELGFAHLDLGDSRVGIIDVPGHEKFVKNMVAGAAGVDFVLLVIAADEGIMPQTREHLEICSLLGVSSGLVALTKADMVEADWLEMVQEEVGEYLENSFLAEAPILPVSSKSGAGLDELKAAINELAGRLSERKTTDLFRLPVDRVFSMKGFGTVVTGTMVSGNVKLGEEVTLYPKGLEAKVRGLQSHGEHVELAPAGRRTAVNLQGVEVADVSRGDWLARPGTLFPSDTWDVELSCLRSSPRPLKHRTEAHFHHGAREVLARLYFLDREELVPGETAVCQVRFAEPLAGVAGDRVVVRSFSPLRAVAGGKLLNPLAGKIKRRSPKVDVLKAMAQAEGAEHLRLRLELAGRSGASAAELPVLTGLAGKPLEKALQEVGAKGNALLADREERRWISLSAFEELSENLTAFLERFHADQPDKAGLTRSELVSAWGRNLPSRLAHFVMDRMLKRKVLEMDGEALHLPGHEAELGAGTSALRDAILAAYVAGGVMPPNVKDVLAPHGLDFKKAAGVFKLLVEEGQLVRVKEDMFYHADAMEKIVADTLEYMQDQKEMTAPEFKDLTGMTRKYLIPVLEYLDREKITVRVGDVRRLRSV